METSVAELRTPLDGRPVDVLLRERAAELSQTGVARIDVTGRLPALPPLVAAHTYRIAAEALTNAVRHAGCSAISVTLDGAPDAVTLTIADDGVGMPAEPRPGRPRPALDARPRRDDRRATAHRSRTRRARHRRRPRSPPPRRFPMIRLLIVDDHPAMRAGLTAVLRAEPGIVLGTASSEEDLGPALTRTKPDVILLDYHLPGADGLKLCRRLKREVPAPGVLLYSAYADSAMVVPAILAGADGLLNKSAPAPELFDALRAVARGDRVLPPVPRELLESAGQRVDPEDLPILAMVVDGTPVAEVAEALRVPPATCRAGWT